MNSFVYANAITYSKNWGKGQTLIFTYTFR